MNMRIFYENMVGRGEDAGIVGAHHAIVFDGLGGTGGTPCKNAAGEVRTEAKIASNAAAQAVEAVIRDNWEAWNEQMKDALPDMRRFVAAKMAKDMKNAIDKQLAREMTIWTHNAAKRYMPSTIAGWVTFPQEDGKLIAVAVWAGDSRCYKIDCEYMQQVSVDDAIIKPGEDVMTEILSQESPRMSNIICVDKPYHLNCKCMELDEAALLFACTDGMYGSLSSPMHLECYMRLAFGGECCSMQDAQEALHSFISHSIVIKDDSCTVCGLGYAPGTNAFMELADAMLTSAEKVDEQYVRSFPNVPELPEVDDADSVLRRVAKSLSTKTSYINGLNAYIERMGNTPEEPVGKQPGSELINDLRGRGKFKRAELESRLNDCDRRIAEEETRLRACVATLKTTHVVTKEVGNRNFTDDWLEKSLVSEKDKVTTIFKYLVKLQAIMFPSGGGGYGVRYVRPPMRDVLDISPFLHDLLVLMESVTPMENIFTGYTNTEVVEQPLSDMQRTQLVTALMGDGPLSNSIVPNLRITLEQMESISACRANIRALKQKRGQLEAEADCTVKLTEEDKAKIAENYALLYARELLREWYKTHVKPSWIEMSETLTASCQTQLEKCWSDIDRKCEDYKKAYEDFKATVMALWGQYRVNYGGTYDTGEQFDSSDTSVPVWVSLFSLKATAKIKPVQQDTKTEPVKTEFVGEETKTKPAEPDAGEESKAEPEKTEPAEEETKPEPEVQPEPEAPEANVHAEPAYPVYDAPEVREQPEPKAPVPDVMDYSDSQMVWEGKGENYEEWYRSYVTTAGAAVKEFVDNLQATTAEVTGGYGEGAYPDGTSAGKRESKPRFGGVFIKAKKNNE